MECESSESAMQILYETIADYSDSSCRISQSELVKWCSVTQKGLLEFTIKGMNNEFLLSPYGKLQVKFDNQEEKERYVDVLKSLLVPKDGQKLILNPVKQQLWISYPGPPEIKVSWCEDRIQYYKHGCDPWIWILAPSAFGLGLILVGLGSRSKDPKR